MPPPGFLDFVADRYVQAKSAMKDHRNKNDLLMMDSSKIRGEKEKYRNKVKEYTHYSIGRKVPESFQKFTPKEIDSRNLLIKSPSILRILTKWTE